MNIVIKYRYHAENARIVATEFPYHITQRGNYRQIVFEEDRDYIKYLELIKEYGERYGLKFWAYCLMSNHVHFIVIPSHKDSLSWLLNRHICVIPNILTRRKNKRPSLAGAFLFLLP